MTIRCLWYPCGWVQLLLLSTAICCWHDHAAAADLCNPNITCPAGTQALGSSSDCATCPAGTFKAESSASCCKLCLAPAVLTSETNCTCPASYFWSVGKVLTTCKRCPKNTYSPSPNSYSCSACPAGTVLNPTRNPTGCVCSAGQQANATISPGVVSGCTACPDDLVNPAPTTATDACKPCPTGTRRANAKTCLCPPATFMVMDSAGYAQSCPTCPDGTVMPDWHASPSCLFCKNSAVASADKTECLCPPGKYSSKVDNKMPPVPGFEYGVWGNKFLTMDGNWGSWHRCSWCPKDEITTVPNLDRLCQTCTPPRVSDDSRTLCTLLCPAGSENIGNLTSPVCQNCSSTSVNPRPGGNCTACPPDKVANQGWTKCICRAGSYPTGNNCTKCPFTKYNATPGGGCKSCPSSKLASTNGITCDTCNTPYFNSAPANGGNASAPNCTSCAAGYYRPIKSVSVCVPCLGDTTSPDGNSWQLCCRSGSTFNATANPPACV